MRGAAVLSVLLKIKAISGSRLNSLESLSGVFFLFFFFPLQIILSVKLKGNIKDYNFEDYLRHFWLAVELQGLVGPTEIIPKADVASWLCMEPVYGSLFAQRRSVGTICVVWIHSVTYILIQQSSSLLLSTNNFLVVFRTQKLEFRKKCKYLVEKVARGGKNPAVF